MLHLFTLPFLNLLANAIDEELPDYSVEFSYWAQFGKMAIVFGAIVGALLLIGWILKRLGLRGILSGERGNSIRIVERKPLSPKSTLYLIEVEEFRILVGDSAGGIRPIAQLPKSDSRTFEEILEQKIGAK